MENFKQAVGTNKKLVIITLIVLLFLCCCTTVSIGAGYYVYKGNSEEIEDVIVGLNEDTEEKTEEETDDNEEVGTEDISEEETTESKSMVQQPTIFSVKSAFLEVKSYKLRAVVYTRSGDVESSVDAQFQEPNREYVVQTSGSAISEEIMIGDKIYSKSQNGPWEELSVGELTGFHQDMVEIFLDTQYSFQMDGDQDGYWKYIGADEFITVELLIEKETNLPYKFLLYDGDSLNGMIQFFNYNDDTINIASPME